MRKYDFIHLLTYWLFWNIVPTVEFKAKWPVGMIERGVFSTDPNDHYRPWLEEHIGKQGRAWDWELSTHDILSNSLTIKVRRDKAKYASMAAMRWA